MQSKSCVYWIRAPHHTDILTEGYVGVSISGAEKRFREHKCAARSGSKLPVHNAIRKYSENIIVETVLQGPSEYCYLIEAALRSKPSTGYNVSAGGAATNLGSKHTDETKARIGASAKGRHCSDSTRKLRSEISRGRKHTEETKNTLREKAKARPTSMANIVKAAVANALLKPWQNPASNPLVWLAAESIYQYLQDNPTRGTRNVAGAVGFTYGQLRVIHKKIKTGWNPNEDTEWLIFSGKLSPDASGDKSIQTGTSPN